MKKFMVIFLIVVSCISKENPDHTNHNCIKIILEQDSLLGSVRNQACKEISLEETIINYTDSLMALDYTKCPDEFVQAFQSHIKAWQRLIPEVVEYDSLSGEMHELFDIITIEDTDSSFAINVGHIWSTWDSVEYYKSKFN